MPAPHSNILTLHKHSHTSFNTPDWTQPAGPRRTGDAEKEKEGEQKKGRTCKHGTEDATDKINKGNDQGNGIFALPIFNHFGTKKCQDMIQDWD